MTLITDSRAPLLSKIWDVPPGCPPVCSSIATVSEGSVHVNEVRGGEIW